MGRSGAGATSTEQHHYHHHHHNRQGYTERAEWLHSLRQLRTRVSTVEKECWTLPRGASADIHKEVDDLHKETMLDDNDRAHFQLQAKTDLRKLRKDLKDAQGMVSCPYKYT